MSEPFSWMTTCARCGARFVTDESISDLLDPPTSCVACAEDPKPDCDPYVYQQGGRWAWNCPCGKAEGGFKRRMDADEDAEKHDAQFRAATRKES